MRFIICNQNDVDLFMCKDDMLFSQSNDVTKKDRPNTTPTVRTFVHLPYIFRSFDLFFFSSLLFMKGISYCVIRRKLEPLDRAKANFKRS